MNSPPNNVTLSPEQVLHQRMKAEMQKMVGTLNADLMEHRVVNGMLNEEINTLRQKLQDQASTFAAQIAMLEHRVNELVALSRAKPQIIDADDRDSTYDNDTYDEEDYSSKSH